MMLGLLGVMQSKAQLMFIHDAWVLRYRARLMVVTFGLFVATEGKAQLMPMMLGLVRGDIPSTNLEGDVTSH